MFKKIILVRILLFSMSICVSGRVYGLYRSSGPDYSSSASSSSTSRSSSSTGLNWSTLHASLQPPAPGNFSSLSASATRREAVASGQNSYRGGEVLTGHDSARASSSYSSPVSSSAGSGAASLTRSRRSRTPQASKDLRVTPDTFFYTHNSNVGLVQESENFLGDKQYRLNCWLQKSGRGGEKTPHQVTFLHQSIQGRKRLFIGTQLLGGAIITAAIFLRNKAPLPAMIAGGIAATSMLWALSLYRKKAEYTGALRPLVIFLLMKKEIALAGFKLYETSSQEVEKFDDQESVGQLFYVEAFNQGLLTSDGGFKLPTDPELTDDKRAAVTTRAVGGARYGVTASDEEDGSGDEGENSRPRATTSRDQRGVGAAGGGSRPTVSFAGSLPLSKVNRFLSSSAATQGGQRADDKGSDNGDWEQGPGEDEDGSRMGRGPLTAASAAASARATFTPDPADYFAHARHLGSTGSALPRDDNHDSNDDDNKDGDLFTT